MRRLAALLFLALAACGADGPPLPPPGAGVSGEARAGVVLGGG